MFLNAKVCIEFFSEIFHFLDENFVMKIFKKYFV